MAWWLIAECGVWPYKEPFFELPEEVGLPLLHLMTQCIPFRGYRMEQAAERLKAFVRDE